MGIEKKCIMTLEQLKNLEASFDEGTQLEEGDLDDIYFNISSDDQEMDLEELETWSVSRPVAVGSINLTVGGWTNWQLFCDGS